MRKVYLLPNFLTTLNMFCGFYSVISSIREEYTTAAWSIIIAAFFDMIDGRVARLTKSTSSFGVEYDSLSDLVSFGFAPSMLIYLGALSGFGRLGWLVAFLFLACGALRLARFNVMANRYSKSFFMGLPIPAAAGMVATFVIFREAIGWPASEVWPAWMMGLSLGLSCFMVSTIPFPSFKEFHGGARTTFGILLLGLLVLILVSIHPEITLFALGMTYVFASLVWNGLRVARRGSRLSHRIKSTDERSSHG